MQVISKEIICDIQFYKCSQDNQEFIAEQIFANKKPRSPIVTDIKKKVQKIIKNNSELIEHPSYINYEGFELVNDEYVLLRKGREFYKPATYYLEEKKLTIEDIANIMETFLEIAKEAEVNALEWQHISLDSFWLDDSKKLKFIDPDIIKEINKYRKVTGIKNMETYQSVEIFKDDTWDEKARIYSAGICFYYLLTSVSPFKEGDKSDLVHDIFNLKVLDPIYLNPSISSNLNEIIMRSISREIDNRFSTWDEVLENLNRAKENGVSASKKEKDSNRAKAAKMIKKSSRKRGLMLFWRDRWKSIGIAFAILAMILMINSMGGREDIITEETSSMEVVGYFYQAINQKDGELLGESTSVNLGRLKRMVLEVHVIESMRSAYEYQEVDERDSLFGIQNLSVRDISNEENKVYKANYIFYYNEPPPPEQRETMGITRHEIEMEDTLVLKKLNDIWNIVEIQGSLNFVIDGNLDGLLEE